MPLVRFNWSPEARILRQFGWIACAAGLVLGGFVWSGRIATAAIIAGLWSGVAAIVRPSLNRPLFVVMSAITYPIGVVLSVVVLAVLFYVIVTPIAVLMRMFGHDPLSRSERPGSATYWLEARPPRPKEDYFRQY